MIYQRLALCILRQHECGGGRANLQLMTSVSADEPGHKPLARCKTAPVVLTLYAGADDYEYPGRTLAPARKRGVSRTGWPLALRPFRFPA